MPDSRARRFLQAAGAGLVLGGLPVAAEAGRSACGRRSRHRRRRHRRPDRRPSACARRACACASSKRRTASADACSACATHFPDGQVIELGGELIDTGHVRIQALAAELGLPLDDFCSTIDSAQRHLVLRRPPHQRSARSSRPSCRSPPRSSAMWPRSATTSHHHATPDARGARRRSIALSIAHGSTATASPAGCASSSTSPTPPRWAGDRPAIGAQPPDLHRYRRRGRVQHLRRQRRALPRARRQRPDPAGASAASSAMRSRPAACSRRSGRCGRLYAQLPARRRGARTCARGRSSWPCRSRCCARCASMSSCRRSNAARSSELAYGTNAKLMIGFDRARLARAAGQRRVVSDLPFQTTWETTRMQPGTRRHADQLHRRPARRRDRHGHAEGSRPSRRRRPRPRLPRLAAARAGMREARFHWPIASVDAGQLCLLPPGDWTGFRGAMGERSATCTSPASTARSTPRASWKAAASPARPRRRRFWPLWAWPWRLPAAAPSRLNGFLNSSVSFCTAACKPITIPSRSPRIPTWGREQKPEAVRRFGLFYVLPKSRSARPLFFKEGRKAASRSSDQPRKNGDHPENGRLAADDSAASLSPLFEKEGPAEICSRSLQPRATQPR